MADRAAGLRVGIGAGQRKMRPAFDLVEIASIAVDLCSAPILYLRPVVNAKEPELKSLPDLMIDGAVPAQTAAEESGFPAGLVIGQEVRTIGQRIGLTVDATRAETTRPGRIEHEARCGLPLSAQAMDVARTFAP